MSPGREIITMLSKTKNRSWACDYKLGLLRVENKSLLTGSEKAGAQRDSQKW